uniref:Uncharacterized protein n=1 Tax=Glossina brevipalpis TaxID=37001 RepID=A0A1A9WEG5_9MUSC
MIDLGPHPSTGSVEITPLICSQQTLCNDFSPPPLMHFEEMLLVGVVVKVIALEEEEEDDDDGVELLEKEVEIEVEAMVVPVAAAICR